MCYPKLKKDKSHRKVKTPTVKGALTVLCALRVVETSKTCEQVQEESEGRGAKARKMYISVGWGGQCDTYSYIYNVHRSPR